MGEPGDVQDSEERDTDVVGVACGVGGMEQQNPQRPRGKRRVAGRTVQLLSASPSAAVCGNPQGRKTGARLLRRIRHPQEKCLGNAPPSELVLCWCADALRSGLRGTTARREHFCSSRTTACGRDARELIMAVPLVVSTTLTLQLQGPPSPLRVGASRR